MLSTLLVLLPLGVGPVPGEFDAEAAAQLRTLVLPDASELRWEEIPWVPRFHEGLELAGAEGKPVLLWVMNGHPLGCT